MYFNSGLNIIFKKKYIYSVLLLEFIYLSLLFKSQTLGIVSFFLLASVVILYFYPELGFAFALSGNLILYWFFDFIEVDFPFAALITYLFLITLASILIILKDSISIRRLTNNKIFIISILIGILLIMGLFYSSDKSYGLSKTGLYFLFNIPALIIGCLFFNNYHRIEKLLMLTFIFGVILFMISFIISKDQILFGYVRFSPSNAINPIVLARSLSISLICAIYFLIRKSALIRIIILLCIPALILPVIWSGSRAPMIGLMLAILLFYLLQPSQSNLKKMVVGIIGIFLSIYFVFTFASTIAVRIVTPVHQEASAAFRFLAWYQSIQDFQGASIFGIGTGSFILETPFLILHWPHNLFLELACENGIFGLLLITVFVFFSFKWSYQNIHRYYKRQDSNKLQISISVFCIFIFALWNAMFSGDIATNPIVWYGAGLIYSMSEIHSHDNKR